MRNGPPPASPGVPDRYQSLRCDTADRGTLSATAVVYGPYFPVGGHLWEAVLVVVSTAAIVGTDTFTFQPFVALAGVKQTVGTAVSTTAASAGSIAVHLPFKCHEQDRLDYAIPEGAVLGVDVTRAAGSLVEASFKFLTRFGG